MDYSFLDEFVHYDDHSDESSEDSIDFDTERDAI